MENLAYPWESEIGVFRRVRVLRALQEPVLACLSRNPSDRPSAKEFLAKLSGLFDRMTTIS